jgi:aminoglycoside 3-N-acetyltransferase
MSDGDYSRSELEMAIRAVGIKEGDLVSLQVSLGRLGLMREVPARYEDMSSAVILAFLSVIGEGGTLIVPTFSYSAGRGETFDVENTPSSIGAFPNVFMKSREVARSADPMMSHAGCGPLAETILADISNESYGSGSVFDNITRSYGIICTLGLGMWWATYCHYVEKMAGAPFRFDKKFTGTIREHGVEREEEWIYFAAPRIANCESNSQAIEARLAARPGFLKTAPIGRGEIHSIAAGDYLSIGLEEMKINPWLTAKGPPIPAVEAFASEPQWREQR